MSYWDSSALVKLYVQEADSVQFRALAQSAGRFVIGSLAQHEARTAFRRREAEGVLRPDEAEALYHELKEDIASGDIVMQPETVAVEHEFGAVLESCFAQAHFIRTNDALHLAYAAVAGEIEFITADRRQRAVSELLGFKVLP